MGFDLSRCLCRHRTGLTRVEGTVGKKHDMRGKGEEGMGRVVVFPHFLRSPEEPDGWSEVSRMGEESPKGRR